MSYSRNEIQALAKRAAQGAGYGWGLAEEAGMATHWLCAHGLDGCAALADLLSQIDGQPHRAWTPGGDWQGEGETLCPVIAGSALSDRADALGGDGWRLSGVAVPLLLLPFVASIARHLETTLRMDAGSAHAITDGTGLVLSGAIPSQGADVTIARCRAIPGPCPSRARAHPDATTLTTLHTFSHRTYAPATEESRLRGAGSGLSDND